MISIGVDVSKGKSTVCAIKSSGQILISPYEVNHTEQELKDLITTIKMFNEEVRVVMEATGVYHLPILNYLKEHDIFVAVINPLIMKKYVSMTLRKAKLIS